MKLKTESKIYNIIYKEHLIKNDAFLRYLEFILEENEEIEDLKFHLFHDEEELLCIHYPHEQVIQRLIEGKKECQRYRKSSLKRILGLDYYPEHVMMDEPFQYYLSDRMNRLLIEATSNLGHFFHEVEVCEYQSLNSYIFPMKGTFLVSDTYLSINSHRWCRNSEFAFDVGSADVYQSTIEGMDVLAVGDGRVIEVFDCLEDSDESTDFDWIESTYSEHERIDGNHVMIEHEHGEISIYSHLKKDSICVSLGSMVRQGSKIGEVGSSGNSACPHLHFHMTHKGIDGEGIPVKFCNLFTYFDQPCDLNETTNIVYTRD